MDDKSSEAFKTIGEVASELAIPQHVLRFWETRFPQVRPLKRGGGRRYYRPEDVALLHGIRFLLYAKGFTIKGVQRLLREQGVRFVAATASGDLRPETQPAAETGSDDVPTVQHSVGEHNLPDDFGLTAPSAPDQHIEEPRSQVADQERRPGFGSFLRRRNDMSGAAGTSSLSKDQADKLQEVILDLLECKRLLDQVR
ncbi:MerR family transcriptional regulator [Fulvimarina sp. MAC8]|uniref:MerR family transcriptional regulator n=1 Tax=Fulvimarina sp. MAC8 TaxID=3162874 RepID=UPI0032ECD5B4